MTILKKQKIVTNCNNLYLDYKVFRKTAVIQKYVSIKKGGYVMTKIQAEIAKTRAGGGGTAT